MSDRIKKKVFLFSYPQPAPQPESFPSPPVDSQTEKTDPKESTCEEEPTDTKDKGCDPNAKEQTSDQAEPSSDSRNEERKHGYKMAFVKSA